MLNPWTKVRNQTVRLQERLTTEDEVAINTVLVIELARRHLNRFPDLENLRRMGRGWALDKAAFEIQLPHTLPHTESGRRDMWFYLEGIREAVTQREREVEDERAALSSGQTPSSSSGKSGTAVEDSPPDTAASSNGRAPAKASSGAADSRA